MIHTFNVFLGTAAMERLTLLLNHVLASEPVAVQRLAPHAGRSIELQFADWPSVLPPFPVTAFRVTAAGLVEWYGTQPPEAPDLRVRIDASNPALAMVRAFAGVRPKIEVSGDAEFAGDLNWLFDNLRWDVQDDLARIVGAGPAGEIARLAAGVAGALRDGLQGLRDLAARAPGAPGRTPPAGPAAR